MKRLLPPLTALLFAHVHAAEEAASTDCVRVSEDDQSARLETAVIRFEKDDASVELLGAIHIADRDYYKALEKRFTAYDVLLYEGIGGSTPKANQARPEVPAAARRNRNLGGLHKLYLTAAEWLELSYQMHEVDYTRENFAHADLSMAEFRRMQSQRNESILRFFLMLSFQAEKPEREPSSLGILKALITRDADGLKYELLHTLAIADEQMAALEGENVIITDRNRKCLEVMDEQLAMGERNLGIFYGAAHFPDMERRLLEDGWKMTGVDWLTAWDVDR